MNCVAQEDPLAVVFVRRAYTSKIVRALAANNPMWIPAVVSPNIFMIRAYARR